MKLPFYKYVVVVLVYRNSGDLEECINSIERKMESARVIVVNAFYDIESKSEIEGISLAHNCDFLNVENKGYGYGNNHGIEYAMKMYDYEYIIISNPDIVIQEFSQMDFHYDIIAPGIYNLKSKEQNPMVIKKSRICEYLIYKGLKRGRYFLFIMGIAINRLRREFGIKSNKLLGKSDYPIYQPHGSFVMIHKRVIEKLHPIYDEKMFLYAEESVLAMRLKENGFTVYYVPEIKVLHKEDGSMKLSGKSVKEELKKSNIYFYETYRMHNGRE